MTEIEQLRTRIRANRAAYYEGKPVVSDEVFDADIDRLEELSPDDEVLNEVGAEPIDPKRKRKNEVEMYSMHKVKILEGIYKWLAKHHLSPDTWLIGSPKFDGMSMWSNETSKRGGTRGNGIEGSECDRHIKFVNGYLDNELPIIAIGEVIMRRDKFEKYAAEGDANARNTVGGILGTPDPVEDELADCDFIRYGLGSNHPEYTEKKQVFDFLNSIQPIAVPYALFRASDLTVDGLKELYMEWSRDYTLDGLILEVNDLETQRKLGRERNGDPAYARAYKGNFEEVKPSPCLGKTWKMSKQGNFIPVINIEPVNLDGATVTNITGNNARYLVDMGIGDGVTLRVKRSGMVIPLVVSVVDPRPADKVELPTHCTCGHALVWNEKKVHLVCESITCPSQALMRIISFFKTLKVDGVSDGVCTQLYDAGFDTIAKILAMKPADMERLDRFGKRKAEKTYNAIRAKMVDIPLATLQHASGFFRILGSKKLALLQHFTELPTEEAVCAIPGFAKISARAYLKGYPLFYDFVRELPLTYKVVVKEVVSEGALLGKSFVFTGVRRKDLEAAIESAGGSIGSSVNKGTAYLVMKEKGSGSTKEKSAQKLGVQILDEQEAEALILG